MRLLKLITFWVGAIVFETIAVFILLAASDGVNFISIRAYVILSGSMEPKVPLGSIVVVRPMPFYFTGDIISFNTQPGSKIAVTHRINKKYETGVYNNWVYETKGDANNSVDVASAKQEQIIGKVFLTIPYLGYAAQTVKTQKGFIFLIIVPATIIIYEEFKRIKKEILDIFHNRHFSIKTVQNNGINKFLIIVSVLAAFFILIPRSISYFSDREQVLGNVFQAGIWGVQTPISTPTPTIIQDITPTPEQIPTEIPIENPTPTPTP